LSALSLLAAGTRATAQSQPRPACDPGRVTITGGFGRAVFSVDVADDDASRAQGLMNVPQMPLSRGMLFVYDRPQAMSFWMRNTLIELDMLFLDPYGVIKHIHHRAQPLDETPILGGGDQLLGVLEINGGLARRLGIAQGDVLQHPAFVGPADTVACD
jgi:uncharacterized membrane protein (UPF0127 family)